MAEFSEPSAAADRLPFREALDGDFDRGVALLTSDLHVVYANACARACLRDHAGSGDGSVLPAPLKDALVAYRDRLHRSDSAAPPGEIVLGAEGARRMRVIVAPLAQGGRRYFIARMSPPGLFAEPTVRRLQTRFQLTVREAQVALAVAKGLTNAEAAAHLGITEKTVKNALMAVFSKCGVRNRVELALKSHDAPFERHQAPLRPTSETG